MYNIAGSKSSRHASSENTSIAEAVEEAAGRGEVGKVGGAAEASKDEFAVAVAVV